MKKIQFISILIGILILNSCAILKNDYKYNSKKIPKKWEFVNVKFNSLSPSEQNQFNENYSEMINESYIDFGVDHSFKMLFNSIETQSTWKLNENGKEIIILAGKRFTIENLTDEELTLVMFGETKKNDITILLKKSSN